MSGIVWNAANPQSPNEAVWSQPWRALAPAVGNAWGGGRNESYRWYEPDVREFYESNPTQAYQGFLQWGFGDRERPLLDYARNYYGEAYAAALRGQEGSVAPPAQTQTIVNRGAGMPGEPVTTQTIGAGQVTPATNGPHWTDYLTPNLVYEIRRSFQMQSAANRGVNLQWMPSGRWVGSF